MNDISSQNTAQNQLTGQTRFAHILASTFSDQIMFVQRLGWHYYDGRRWTAEGGIGDRKARQLLDKVLKFHWNKLADIVDSEVRKAETRKLESVMSSFGRRGTLEIAEHQPELNVLASELDADPYILNVANGTLDLHTMELRDHNPMDRLTKVAVGAYEPDSTSTEWLDFLTRILPDPEVRAFLQRFIGYSLLGTVVEHIFAIAHGSGQNGKSTFTETVTNALGDYAQPAPTSLFMRGHYGPAAGQATPDVVKLRGVRLAVAAESDRAIPLAEAEVKNITGGNTITARALHKDPITFEPSHTILMETNYLPKITGRDEGIWRRITAIPFTEYIPPEERDPELKSNLMLQSSAILTWAIEGYISYKEIGLAAPEAVQLYTNNYRTNSDSVTRFVMDMCTRKRDEQVLISALFTSYKNWCHNEEQDALPQRELLDILVSTFGCELKTVKGYRYIRHVTLDLGTAESNEVLEEITDNNE